MGRIGGDPGKEGVSDAQGRKNYRNNYDHIVWSDDSEAKPGIYYQVPGGDLVHEDDLTPAQRADVLRVHRSPDSVNIESAAMGCAPSQIPEFKKELAEAGISGVKFKPNGNMIFKDRATKLQVMKARQMHDRDEVRG